MLSNYASNSILAKARAKYGQRLTQQNYRELVNLTSVSDVASYLKTRTHYKDILANVQESAVHRGNLEKLLRNYLLIEIQELCKFERSVGEHLFEYVLLREEINELLDFLRYLQAGHPEDYILVVSDLTEFHAGIDLMRLASIKTYDQLLEFLSHSPLKRILQNFKPTDGRDMDFPMIEAAMDKYLYDYVLHLFDEQFKGQTRQTLQKLVCLRAELSNLRRIVRSKRYYTATPEVLMSQIIDHGYYISRKQMKTIIEAETAEEAVKILEVTPYRKRLARHEFTYIDDFASRVLSSEYKRLIRFSTSPAVVMDSYIGLADIEIENVTNIIEGIRYNIGPEAINELLII